MSTDKKQQYANNDPFEILQQIKVYLKDPKLQAVFARIAKLPSEELRKELPALYKKLTPDDTRKFKLALKEKQEKRLAAIAVYEAVDWTDQESLYTTFPHYIQEQRAIEKSRKAAAKMVDLEAFVLKKPLTNENLIDYCRLHIEPHKKIYLSGTPGTGKSVLFRTLAGGKIKNFPSHLNVHLCQEIEVSSDAKTLLQTVVQEDKYREALLECDRRLTALVEAKSEEYSAEDMEKIVANKKFVTLKLKMIRSEGAELRASKMLRVLGFDEVAQTKSTNDLSGGLRMRVALCAAFFLEPDILLLDEPTNHLDFPSLLWLENKLRSYRKTFILTSNDRELIENTCYSVMLLEDKKVQNFNCGFKAFNVKRDAANAKKAIQVDKFLARHRNVDPSTPLAREKKDKQDWLRAYEAYKVQMAGKFTFPPLAELKNEGEDCKPEDISLIDLKDVRFSYNPETLPFVFDNKISFPLTASTRIGIMGPNGAGKSTFLKLLTGRLTPTEGSVTRHSTASVAYFSQHVTMELDLEDTPIEYMMKIFPGTKSALLRNHLEKVGITGLKVETQMKALTGGQQSCCVFAKVTFTCPHLLILDEPTNFLDMNSVDSLVSAAHKYKGALLVVSHCRSFLKRCANQYLSIVPGQFLLFDSMKECEHATYTFIQELESGEKVSAKDLVGQQKHSSGASNKDKKIENLDRDENGVVILGAIAPDKKANKSKALQKAEEEKAAAEKEAERIAKKKAKKAAKRKAKMAVKWEVGQKCMGLVKGVHKPGTIIRVNALGVTVEFDTGAKKMLTPKQLLPMGAPGLSAGAKPKKAGGNKGGKPKGGKGGRGGRGGQRR